MKRKIAILPILFISFYSFSQSIKYIDENMKPIDSVTYYNKCNSDILKCLNFKTSSLNIYKVEHAFKFGVTDSLGYSQVRKFLQKNSTKTIKENAFLMVKYKDTLFDLNAVGKNTSVSSKNIM